MRKKGNKKASTTRSIQNVALATSIINLLIAIINLIKDMLN